MENYIKYITDITYQSELTLDIKDVKGLIPRRNPRALARGMNGIVLFLLGMNPWALVRGDSIRTNNLCRSVLKLLLHKLCAH